MIELRTLGRLELRDSAGRDLRAVFSASKLTALLSYLAIAPPRGFHRRDTLVALLWPELDQEHARGALRQALYTIRSSITDGTLLRAGDEQIGLDTEGFWSATSARRRGSRHRTPAQSPAQMTRFEPLRPD